jgi:FkbM family methyltransferase
MFHFRELIKSWIFKHYEVPDMAGSVQRLKKSGFSPSFWVDVGAFQGEAADLFRTTWPEASGVCFEGQTNALLKLKNKFQSDPLVTVISKLVGSEPKKEVILHGKETYASILEEVVNPKSENQHVEMTTLDREIQDMLLKPGKNFIKIDTQGYELEILKGAEKSLRTCGALVLELNFIDIYKAAPMADEVIGWLKNRDFQIYDIAGLIRRARDRALWQADVVFVPTNSPLRSSKSYD